jgi:hypothetical protein
VLSAQFIIFSIFNEYSNIYDCLSKSITSNQNNSRSLNITYCPDNGTSSIETWRLGENMK